LVAAEARGVIDVTDEMCRQLTIVANLDRMPVAVDTNEHETVPHAQRFAAAWNEFFAAVRRARGRAAQEAAPDTLSLAQFQLLVAFETERELSIGAIAEAGGVAAPTATRMLANLERDGIVERHPSETDGRSVIVKLTPRGQRMLRAKRKRIAAKQRQIYESLNATERRQAEAILHRLAEAMEEL
jgi:DNA-binding MarR family transcriptional regulator